MSREVELIGMSVAVTATFGLLFSVLNVDASRVEASIPHWDATEIVVSAPDTGEYGIDLVDVHLTRPMLVNPSSEVISRLRDCGASVNGGRFAITPPVVLDPGPHSDLGETSLVKPNIEMPELRRPLPALLDLQNLGPILRIA